MLPNKSLQPTVIPLRGLPAAELRRYVSLEANLSQFFQISEKEWKEVANPYDIACLNVAAEYFVTQFGITFIEFYDDGLGSAKAFVIQVGDAQFWLMSHFDEPMFGVSTLSYEPTIPEGH